MAEGQLPVDQFDRPLRFRPSWPPAPSEKQTIGWGPGYSLAFRKSSWPPPSSSDDNNASAFGAASLVPNGPNLDNSSAVPNAAQGGVGSPSQNNAGETTVKPKRAVRDYSAFYAKNAAPPSRKVYVVQPGSVQLPDAFTANPDESTE